MQKLRSWRINAERALDRTRTCDPGIRNPLLYPAELRARMADWHLRMVGTIGNGKIMTKPKNTSRSGLASFGQRNCRGPDARLTKELKLIQSLASRGFQPYPTDSRRVSKNPLTSRAYTVAVDLCRPAKRSTSFG